MFDWTVMGEALSAALNVSNLFGASLGIFLGSFLGAIPGLNGAMAIALLIPVTFTWDPIFAIAMLIGCWKGSVYGGSISAVLLNAPGTPEAVATTYDGWPLAKQGKAGKALKMALYASVIGALISDSLLMVAAPPIAALALMFGPPELAMLIAFALVVVAGAGEGSHLKGLIAAALGVLLATVGLDPIQGMRRFTFDCLHLDSGIDLLAMVIGLLVTSEILYQIGQGWADSDAGAPPTPKTKADTRVSMRELIRCLPVIFRSSLLGSICGALPGVGSITAAFLGYDQAKGMDRHPENYGKGELKGVAAPEAANNAVCGAALIPLVTLGIPGALAVAVIMGGFLIHGLAPGPMLMVEHPKLIYALFMLLIITDFFMLFITRPLLILGQWVVRVPRIYLFPVIITLCVVGSFGTRMSVFDVQIMAAFSIIGYLLKKWDISPGTFLIAFILGPMAENYIRQSLLISGGNPLIFVTRPIAAGFLLALVAFTAWAAFKRRKGEKAQ